MEDGIVDPTVYSRYCNKIMTFGTWIHDNDPSWFTEFGMVKYEELQVLKEGEGSRLRRKRIKDEWLAMLRNAKNTPIVHIDMITPVSIMEGYISNNNNSMIKVTLEA
jgi:hypothetical protein